MRMPEIVNPKSIILILIVLAIPIVLYALWQKCKEWKKV